MLPFYSSFSSILGVRFLSIRLNRKYLYYFLINNGFLEKINDIYEKSRIFATKNK